MENNIQTLLDDRARKEAENVLNKPYEKQEEAPTPIKIETYKAIKGDRVDELFAIALNNANLDIPVQRLGEGNYMFGSRKIYCKIMNDKLVVRVGGGFMLIDEFLATYGKQEMDKVTTLKARGSFVQGAQSPNRMKSPNWKGIAGRISPNARGSMVLK